MNCEHPIRIKNPYSGKWMYVPCRHCDACRISAANRKAVELEAASKNYKYMYFLTLTYAPEYVPYVIDGFSYIMRGSAYEIIEDLPYCVEGLSFNPDSKLLAHHHCPAVGVLYYRDVQLFMKRFRKYLSKHYGRENIKFFAAGEYGSKFGRPHFHLLILSNSLQFAECQDSAHQCWKYHDWNRLIELSGGKDENCKVCDKGTSYYITMYCNCSNCDLPVSQVADFRPKTIRSKNMDFGMCPQELLEFKKGVRRIASEDFRVSCNQVTKPFFYIDTSRKDNVSTVLVSKKFVDAAFQKPHGFYEMSFGIFLSRAYRIVATCRECERLGISKYTDFGDSRITLKAADHAFYRRYKYHEKVLGFRLDLGDYCALMWKVLKYYACCLLFVQMSEYERLENKDDYVLQQIDTKVECLQRRRVYFYNHVHKLYRDNFRKLDLECPPHQRRLIDDYVRRYKQRLLTKHLNDGNNILFNP